MLWLKRSVALIIKSSKSKLLVLCFSFSYKLYIIYVIIKKGYSSFLVKKEESIVLFSHFNNLIKVFEKMHERTHGNILIISHQERIMQLADTMIVIADGKVRTIGTKDEVFPALMGEFSENCGFRGKED